MIQCVDCPVSQDDDKLIDKYLKMANIDQVKPVPATIRPLPLASLNSLAAVQKSLGEDHAVAAAALAGRPSPAISASAPAPIAPSGPTPAGSADAVAEAQSSGREPLSARAPPALQGALQALPAADGGGDDSAAIAAPSLAAQPEEVSEAPVSAAAARPTEARTVRSGGGGGGGGGGGVVGVLIHDIAQDLGM